MSELVKRITALEGATGTALTYQLVIRNLFIVYGHFQVFVNIADHVRSQAFANVSPISKSNRNYTFLSPTF